MQLKEVTDKNLADDFLKVNVLLNASNPNYIQNLDSEINNIFDASKNKHLKNGEVIRWILKDDHNNLTGRIAAFVTPKYVNNGTQYKTGGIGFFDCIDDDGAAKLLFDAAKNWLKQKGCEAMDGPINIGDRDKWWGLMVEGFDAEPIYGMSFNPPYYEKLFLNYGFKNYYNQYYYRMRVNQPLPEKFEQRHKKFASKKDYSARHISKTNLKKHAKDFAAVYNAAWAQHGEAKQVTQEQILKLFNVMKPVMDEKIIWFAYYKEEPIAMWINIPDLNQYYKHFKGKFGLWQKLRLLLMKKTGQCKVFTGIAFGVVPKFQALGIDSFMIYEGAQIIQSNNRYHTYEMGWAGDWNPKMVNIYKNLGAEQSRRMVTLRYMINNDLPFERHPIMDYQ